MGKQRHFPSKKLSLKVRNMYIAKSLLELVSEFPIIAITINIHYQGSEFIVAFVVQTRYIRTMTLLDIHLILSHVIASKVEGFDRIFIPLDLSSHVN